MHETRLIFWDTQNNNNKNSFCKYRNSIFHQIILNAFSAITHKNNLGKILKNTINPFVTNQFTLI